MSPTVKLENEVQTLKERLVESRRALALARDFLESKMIVCEQNREHVLSRVKGALEATPAVFELKRSALEFLACLVEDHVNPCSCCRSKGCHQACRCSNTRELARVISEVNCLESDEAEKNGTKHS